MAWIDDNFPYEQISEQLFGGIDWCDEHTLLYYLSIFQSYGRIAVQGNHALYALYVVKKFDSLREEVSLVLSDDAPVREEWLDLAVLQKRLDELLKEIETSDSREDLQEQITSLRELIRSGGKYKYPLLGAFSHEPSPTVYLYMGNISATDNPLAALGSTFVHEMFHARNYFACGSIRSVPEIDEAMVEAATLQFLDLFTSDEGGYPSFDQRKEYREIFEWYLNTVERKKKSFGLLPSYGFGKYLYEHNDIYALTCILARYASVSGELGKGGDEVLKETLSRLNPVYPFDGEDEVEKGILLSIGLVKLFGELISVDVSDRVPHRVQKRPLVPPDTSK